MLLPPLLVTAAEAATEVTGYVDLVGTANLNDPVDRQNFIPGMGTTGKRAGELGLNVASLGLRASEGSFGGELVVIFGPAAEVLHAGEPGGPGVLRNVQTAFATWRPVAWLELGAGLYPSHIGFETFASKDNFTLTRGLMAELSPYYQSGLRVAADLSGGFSAQLHVVNGWQLASDDNDGKTLGLQLAWAGQGVGVAVNGLAGPETAASLWRVFGDVVITAQPATWLSLAATADAAWQEGPGAGAAASTWVAAGLHARVAPVDALAFFARVEWFRDDDGVISGVARSLAEGTIGVEWRPATRLIVKLEGRYDHATAPSFAGDRALADGAPALVDDQLLVALGVVAVL